MYIGKFTKQYMSFISIKQIQTDMSDKYRLTNAFVVLFSRVFSVVNYQNEYLYFISP